MNVSLSVGVKINVLFFLLLLLLNTYVNHSEQIGLDWNKLKEKLNPDFDWEAAVQKALGNISIEEVCSHLFL